MDIELLQYRKKIQNSLRDQMNELDRWYASHIVLTDNDEKDLRQRKTHIKFQKLLLQELAQYPQCTTD